MPQFIHQQQVPDSISTAVQENNIFGVNGIARFDSVNVNSDTAQVVVGRFFKGDPIEMVERISRTSDMDWIIYLLLILLLGIALIWHFIPDRVSSFFNISVSKTKTRNTDNVSNTPGFLISFFFFANYIIGFSIFVFVLLKWLTPMLILGYPDLEIIMYAGISVAVFYLFRILFIQTSGFLFRTKEFASEQKTLYINSDNTLGVLLIPVLILVLFVNLDFLLIFGAIIVVTIYIFKWFQTFILGKSVPEFSLLHLFLYLCTLEIIPLLVFIKLLEKGII